MLKYWIINNKFLFLSYITNIILIVMLNIPKKEVSIIIADEHGPRLFSNSILDQEAREKEISIFIQRFFENYLNYDLNNYKKNITEASQFLTYDLWENQELDTANTVSSNMKNQPYSIKSTVENIDLKEESNNSKDRKFEVLINSIVVTNGKMLSEESKYFITIKEIQRSEKNLWGMKINELKKIL